MRPRTLDFKGIWQLCLVCVFEHGVEIMYKNFSSCRPEAKDGTEQLVEAHPRSDWQLMHHPEGTSAHSKHAAIPPENLSTHTAMSRYFSTKNVF